MSRPTDDDNRSAGSSTRAWDDDASEETRVVRPPAGGYQSDRPSGSTPAENEPAYPASAETVYRPPAESGYRAPAEPGHRGYAEPVERPDPFSAPMPEVSAPPVGSPIAGAGSGEPAAWAPSYSDQPVYSAQQPVTSVYPQTSPGYAPAGYPPAYAPAVVVPPPAMAALPEQTSSRVGPGFLCALIGLLLTAGGLWLVVKYGAAVVGNVQQGTLVIKDSARVTFGAVLLLAAVALNGWSPWSTIVPGIVLTGIGGWALFDVSAPARAAGWTKSVLPESQTIGWHSAGFTLVLGLVLLAASAAAVIARAGGKRDGRILGRRQT